MDGGAYNDAMKGAFVCALALVLLVGAALGAVAFWWFTR